jgi:phage I-like protein
MTTTLKKLPLALALAVASFESQAATDQPGVVALAVSSFASTASTGADGESVTLYDIPVLPAGSASAPVDRRFDGGRVLHDNEAIAALFNSKGRKAPVDVGHGTEWDGSAAAVGWVLSLYVAEDTSLWAKCELNAEGQGLIDGKKFGFTSPTLRGVGTETGDWMATSLKSLALTNNPALEMSSSFTVDAAESTEASAPAAAEAPAEVEAPAVDAAPTAEAPEAAAAALADAAPAPAEDTAGTFAALQTSTATLTTERDAALVEVQSLTTQLTSLTAQVASLTAERDTARSDLAAFTTKATTDAIQAAIDEANIAGRAYPFEREMLTTYGATQGLAKLSAYLTARPAFSSAVSPGTTPADGVPADVQAYLSRMGLPLAAYVAGAAN